MYTSGVWNDFYVTSIDNLTSAWLPNTYHVYSNQLENVDLDDTRTITLQQRMMITLNDINPTCYMVTKVLDMAPQGVIKLSLKMDDFNPKRDDVKLRVCDYYNDTGDVVVERPTDNPAPPGTSTIYHMIVNSDDELEDAEMITSINVGETYYFRVEYSHFAYDADWRVELVDDDDEYTEDERYALARLITLRKVDATTVSVRPGKSYKLPGKTFKLSVCDDMGNYYSSIDLEVSE